LADYLTMIVSDKVLQAHAAHIANGICQTPIEAFAIMLWPNGQSDIIIL